MSPSFFPPFLFVVWYFWHCSFPLCSAHENIHLPGAFLVPDEDPGLTIIGASTQPVNLVGQTNLPGTLISNLVGLLAVKGVIIPYVSFPLVFIFSPFSPPLISLSLNVGTLPLLLGLPRLYSLWTVQVLVHPRLARRNRTRARWIPHLTRPKKSWAPSNYRSVGSPILDLGAALQWGYWVRGRLGELSCYSCPQSLHHSL